MDNRDFEREYEKNRQQEIEDFFAQFDKISDDFSKGGAANQDEAEQNPPSDAKDTLEFSDTQVSAGRSRRHKNAGGKKSSGSEIASGIGGFFAGIGSKLKNRYTEEYDVSDLSDGEMTSRKKKKKKYKLNVKRIILLLLCLGLLACAGVGVYAGIIIKNAPEIDPDNIYSMLAQSSVLYDAEGNVISTVGSSYENRTIIEYADLPQNLCNAFIAIEDKTFWTHHGFNIIRIFGAIKESIFSGGQIGGTSTITQQLARNVFLADIMSERSVSRKIAEAWYSTRIEKKLSKEKILEAYLNTIDLGFGSHGVQAAAQAYFSKDVQELDLIECAALASLPKAPSKFALVKRLNPEDVDPDKDVIIYESADYTYVYNGDISKDRRMRTLKNMEEQGLITKEEREAAEAEDLLTHINPNMSSLTEISSYFADYVVEEVIKDFMTDRHIDYSEAHDIVYNNGLQIYTTMNTDIQMALEQEYADPSNFPSVAKVKYDGNGNVIGKSGKLLLYAYGNMISGDENFYLQPDEYEWMPNGDLKLLKGKRLNFYKTTVNGESDVSIEFKNMFVIEDGVFYSIGGGNILIPQGVKKKDSDGNCVIQGSFFDGEQQYIRSADGKSGLYVDSKHYALKQKVIQPQSAMVITDYHTGQVQAMVGGRDTVGRLLFNRATATRQPGSSIKPICVYGAALQKSVDTMRNGSTPVFENYGSSENYAALFGTYMTAGSVIDDSPMTLEGRQWPKNWYSGYRGLYTLRTAVEQSVNVCAVKVFFQVGAEYAADYAKKFGLSHIVETGDNNDMNPAALALGGMTNGESPLEMASAYGTYANGGLYVSPICYTQVTNKRGEVLLENSVYTKQACDEGVAFIMTDILRSTVSSGIAHRAAIGTQPVGGKTGTTTDNYDAWFVGFTPQYSAACWIGNDINIELSEGSNAAAKLWSKIMKRACDGLPAGSFKSQPEDVISVTIDTKSGKLPTEESSYDYRGTVRSEYFISGTQPTTYDDVHTYVQVCNDSGYLATPYCTNTSWKFGVKRPYLVNPSVGDIEYEVPHYYCPYHNPDHSKYPTSDSGLDPTGAYTPSMPSGGQSGSGSTDAGEGGLGGNPGESDTPSWIDTGSGGSTTPTPAPESDPTPAPTDGGNADMPSWLTGN